MKKLNLFFSLLFVAAALCAATVTEPAELPDYYAAVAGQKNDNLFNAIHTIANKGFKQLSYNGLWAAYEKTDLYPAGHANAGKIWDMYSKCSFTYSTNQCGNYSAECSCYNREHSIPKSWFCSCTTGMGADLFHLVPTDGKVNGKRGNYAFGEVASATYTYDNSKLGSAKNVTITNTVLGSSFTTSSVPGTVFEPDDEYKGDFARGYFGTMIKWTTVYTMSSGDGAWFFNNTYTEAGHFGLADYGIALLMKWHRQDPVSQKEIDRNNGIQATQGNRNPFIDYPYLAEYLWGEKAGETASLEELLGSFDAEFIPGVSDGRRTVSTNPIITSPKGSVAFGAVAVNTNTTQTITVQGRNLTNNVTLTLSGINADLFSLSATTVSVDDALAGKTITITYQPTSEGNHTATLTLSSTDAASVEVTLTGSGASTYTITYNAGNGTCSITQSTELSVGAGVELPTASPAASCADWTFVGWSTTAVSETQTAPTLLQAGDMYYPTANGVLYAVYKMTEGGTGGSTNVVFNVSDIATKNSWVNGTKYSSYTIDGITISYSGGDNDGKYYSSNNSWRSYVNGSVVVSGTTTISNVISEPSQTFSKESDGTWKYTGTGKAQFTQFTITVSGTGGPTTYATSPSCQTCTLDGIELNTANVTTNFFVGDAFDSEGLVVTATYSGCDEHVVVPTGVSEPDMSSAGTQTVTVSYTENGITKTAGYNIAVNAKPTYTITLNQNAGGTIKADVSSATAGTVVTLSATANAHYTFSEWAVLDGEANDVAVTDNQFVMPASNVEVEATFVEIQYAVNTTLTHVTAANDNPTTAGVSDDDILMAFDAETGYQLPLAIEVKMGNELLTAGYDYKWTENGVLNIVHTGGITAPLYITIKATPIQYEILFLDDDNTTELAVVQVNHGEIPSYPNATPTKTSTDQYDYTFTGWSPEVVSVTGVATYTAVYAQTVRKYTVTFVDADGTELQKSDVEYGAMPTCSSPTKTSTDQYDYTFTGWSPEVVSVTGAATYTAVYTQTVRKYTVTFVDFDGTLLNEQSVEYGQAAVAPQDPTREGYTFAGWDAAFNSITANLTVTATYTKNTETPVCEVVVIDPVCYVTNDLLYVAGLPTGTSLAVFDCTGRLVEQRTAATDTETFDLSNGLYLVRIQANGEQHTLKIVL